MKPILLQLGPISVFAYGLMVSCAFLIGTYLAQREATRQNLPAQKIIDLSLCIVISGVVGARLLYVLQNIQFYRVYPLRIVMLHEGGLSFFGGFFVALAATLIFLRIQRLPAWTVLDIFVPYLALGQAIGRIGCLLNGCCFGKVTTAFGAICFPGETICRYPIQVYNSLLLLALYIVLRYRQKRGQTFPGQLFLLYCILYSTIRFISEFFRGDHTAVIGWLTLHQIFSLMVFTMAGVWLWKKQNNFVLRLPMKTKA
ncbi:MAG: prolipoprotein diacylglyceryl transferase [Candidatus Omnitrophota bacterium]